MIDPVRNASTRDLAEALFVALAVYFILGTLGGLETLTFVASSVWPESEDGSKMLWVSLYLLVVRAAIGFGLIRYRKILAESLVPDGQLPAIPATELVGVLVAGAGAFVFVPSSARLATGLVFGGPTEERFSEALLVALSAALFFGARGVAGLWARARKAP